MNHEYILWVSLSDLSEPRIQTLREDEAIYCISVLLIPRCFYCFSKPNRAVRSLPAESPLEGSEQRRAEDLFFRKGAEIALYLLMPSDNGPISLVLDKPADVRIITQIINKRIFWVINAFWGTWQELGGWNTHCNEFCALSEAYKRSKSGVPPEHCIVFSLASVLTTLFLSCLLWAFLKHIFYAKH